MKRQLFHATVTLARHRVREDRFLIRMKNLMEQRRVRKHSERLLCRHATKGDACIAAEKLSAQKMHLDAAKIWVAVGMRDNVVQEVRNSGMDPKIAKFCAEHGMKWEMKELLDELARKGDVLHASNFAYAIGEKGRAVDLGLVHLATESNGLPDVFRENERILKKIARKYVKEKNYGTAGRIYERMGKYVKAAKTYIKGGHLDELERMKGTAANPLNANKFFSWGLVRKAYIKAAETKQDECKWIVDLEEKGKPLKYRVDDLGAQTVKYAVLGALPMWIGMMLYMLEHNRIGGIAGVIFSVLASAVYGFFGGSVIGLVSSIAIGKGQVVYTKLLARSKEGTKTKPLPLAPYPIVFSGGEETKLLQSPETQAEKLESEGKLYEAGLIYAKMGNKTYATECANQLANEGKREQARELWIMVFDTTYLDAEEMEKTDPESAKAVFAELGIEK